MGQYSTIHNVWGCKPNVVSVCCYVTFKAFKPLHPQNQTLCHEPNLGSITVRVSMQMGIPWLWK